MARTLGIATILLGLGALPGLALTTVQPGLWSNGATWGGSAPVAGEAAVVSHDVIIDASTPALLSVAVSSGATLTFDTWDGILSATTVTIDGTVTHTANTDADGNDGWQGNARVNIACTDLTVSGGGQINADALGYRGALTAAVWGQGPGAGRDEAGGSYGGQGLAKNAAHQGVTYGLASAAAQPGSGGGGRAVSEPGGHGGGVVRIVAGGHLQIDGTISADGQTRNNNAGGGSGGAIYLACQSFGAAGGVVRARGGGSRLNTGNTGWGGGGGRIAVAYDPGAQAAANAIAMPIMELDASGGYALDRTSRPGTLYLTDASFYPRADLTLRGAELTIPGFVAWAPASLTVASGLLVMPDGLDLTVTGNLDLTGNAGGIEMRNSQLDVGGSLTMNAAYGTANLYGCATVQIDGSLAVAAGALHIRGADLVAATLNVGSNIALSNTGGLHLHSGSTDGTDERGLWVTVVGDIVIAGSAWLLPYSSPRDVGSVYLTAATLQILSATAGIDAQEKGYEGGDWYGGHPAGYGPGHGDRAGSAGYGGAGAAGGSPGGTAGGTYGLEQTPTQPGSGGGGYGELGGNGGGLVWLDIDGTATVNGVINANSNTKAKTNAGAGGSGGGIYITCVRFEGDVNGQLTANGGNARLDTSWSGGSGGGGRIAVWYEQLAFNPTQATAAPGLAADAQRTGEAGTVFFGSLIGAPTAQCQDVTVCADRGVDPALIDAGSHDANGDPVSLALTPLPPYAIGTHTVTLTVTDVYTQTDSCTATVTAVDPGSAKVWNGGGDWHGNPENWVPCVPENGDEVIIQSGTVSLTASSPSLAAITVDAAAALQFDSWSAVLAAGSVTVAGTVTHTANTDADGGDGWQPNARVNIACTDLTVSVGGAIDVTAQGYRGATNAGLWGSGPGAGRDEAGGSFGGRGLAKIATHQGSTYGSDSAPEGPGSGGGGRAVNERGGHGGGAVWIVASGHVQVDGTIVADGETRNNNAGGGSGGAVYIECQSFDAAGGTLSARGGGGRLNTGNTGWGGGGGRLAIHYNLATQATVNAGGMPDVTLDLGSGYALNRTSRPGTLYLTNASFYPRADLPLRGAELAIPGFTAWTPTTLSISQGLVVFPDSMALAVTGDLTIAGNAGGIETRGTNLTIAGSLVMNAAYGLSTVDDCAAVSFGSVTVSSGELAIRGIDPGPATVQVGADIVLNGGNLQLYSGAAAGSQAFGLLLEVAGDVVISGGSWLLPHTHSATIGAVRLAAANLTIADASSGIDAQEKGYAGGDFYGGHPAGYGPGHGEYAAGAGYGGVGAARSSGNPAGTPGGVYGSLQAPAEAGSGGGGYGEFGGGGGGVVWLEVPGTVTVNGLIKANSNTTKKSNGGGGGSGGAIYIRCTTLTGSVDGQLSANGGHANYTSDWSGGSGGGGRIALWYVSSSFSGTLSATNGLAYDVDRTGQPGTVFSSQVPCYNASPGLCDGIAMTGNYAVTSGGTGVRIGRAVSAWTPSRLAWTESSTDLLGADLSNAVDYQITGLVPTTAYNVKRNGVVVATVPTAGDGSLSISGIALSEVLVEVELANAPPTARCRDLTVALGPDATVTVAATALDNETTPSSDPDGDPLQFTVAGQTELLLDCSNLGDNAVTLTVDDGNGGQDTCAAVITVTSAGTCETVTNTVLNSLCNADPPLAKLSQLPQFVDDAIAAYLGGGAICGTLTIDACRAELLDLLLP